MTHCRRKLLAAFAVVFVSGCSANSRGANGGADGRVEGTEVQGNGGDPRKDSSAAPVVNIPGGAALLKGTVSLGGNGAAESDRGTEGGNLQGMTCESRLKAYQSVLQTMGQEILMWCNDKYPGDCAARRLCFETLTKRTSSQAITLTLSASQKVSGSETSGRVTGGVSSSSTEQTGSQFVLAVQVKVTFGASSGAGESVVCQTPLKTAFGRGFANSLKQAFESSALGGLGASCAPGPDLAEFTLKLP